MTTLEQINRDLMDAYDRLRVAKRDANRLTLMSLALTIREEFPSATHFELGTSDQGDFLDWGYVIDPDSPHDDNERSEEDDDWPGGMEDELRDLAWNLEGEVFHSPWGWFIIEDPAPTPYGVTSPTGRAYHYVFDIDLILFWEGDGEAAVNEAAREAGVGVVGGSK